MTSALRGAKFAPNNSSGSPALFKRTIALSLKKWRQEAQLTQKHAATRLDRTVPHISNLESGQLPTLGDLELLLDLYGKADRIPFMRELLAAARKATNWWTEMSGAVPPWFDLFLGLESGATELSSLDLAVVPGLLQTRAYAEAIFTLVPDLSADRIRESVEVRLNRQQRVLDGTGVHLQRILDESVLHRMRGGPAVTREQFEHLLEVSERPHIDIQILPFDSDAAHEGGPFTIMKFPPEMEGDPGLVYIELPTGAQYFEKPEEIELFKQTLNRLRSSAASPEVSRRIIERRLKEVKR
jgi:transcriptional regulator with XRE-family HTH domain